MKTSLLLIGLAMGVGIAGTAQAADATTCPHAMQIQSQSLSDAWVNGSGVLSELSSLLSGHQGKSDSAASSNNDSSDSGDSGMNGHAGQRYRNQPGPTRAASRHAHRGTGDSHGNTTAPVGARSSGGQLPASTSSDNTPPTLGWQSLLPGSIQ